jgi:outer membrane receptor for ferrienterochelin and colicins
MRHATSLLVLMIPAFTFAQTMVKGMITDKRSGEPVSNVSVTAMPSQRVIMTNASGHFSLYREKDSILEITHTGYETVQQPITSNKLTVQINPSTKDLEEIVVSGTLKEVSISKSPIPVETYSAKFFRKNPVNNLFESMSFINGVQPQLNCNVCNTGDIHINGLEGPYTMILVDGMPIVSSLSAVYGMMGLPTSLIKRVEIVKGPASTLYGSEAVGGLINVITKDPENAPLIFADVQATSKQEYNLDASAKFEVGKANALLGVNGFYYWSKDDINGDNFTDMTLQKRFSVFNKWSFERKSKKPFSIAFRYFTEDRWGGQLQWSKQWRLSDSVYGENIITHRFESFGSYTLPIHKGNFVLDYSYNWHHQNSAYGSGRFLAKQHTAFAQLRYQRDLGVHSLTIGMPYRYVWYDDNTPATYKPDGSGNNPAPNRINGIFAQDEINFNDKWTLLGGLRLEHHNIQGNVWAPRSGLKYNINKHHLLRLTYGNGFRVVNLFTEDHLALNGARELEIRGELKPERSNNINLNYTGKMPTERGSFFGMDLSAFYTRFMNKIIPDYDSDPQKIIYDNITGYAISKGISGNFDLTLRNGLKTLIGITYMDVFTMENDSTGKRVKETQIFAPKWQASYSISYNWFSKDITFDITGKVYGPQRLPVVPNDYRPEYSPWFTLANVQITKRIGDKAEIYGGVRNLLNFIPKDPILRPFDPFDKNIDDPANINNYTFDPSYNYAPVQGIKGFLGVRFSLQ